MLSPLSDLSERLVRQPVLLGSVVAGIAAAGALWYWLAHRGPTPEQREAIRRQKLAASGRIIDGTVTDAIPSEREPRTILYEYRIAGVTYECGQDVSLLHDRIGDLRIDLPVQVRYDPRNPANSIIVSETWNGLWHWENHGKSASGNPAPRKPA